MDQEWRVEEIGEGTARVEEDGQIRHVPRWLLPQAAGENDIVKIEITDVAGARRVELRIDAIATREALEKSRGQVAATPRQNDPGGPIKL
jgi:hypothetical protein